MNWEKEFENKFVADDILDCIPTKNWEEMKEEIFGFIRGEKRKSFKKGEDKGYKEGCKVATDDTGWKAGSYTTPHNSYTTPPLHNSYTTPHNSYTAR